MLKSDESWVEEISFYFLMRIYTLFSWVAIETYASLHNYVYQRNICR